MAQKYSEIVYMVLDQLKLQSRDTNFNEDHVLSLVNKYRAFLLKQKYGGDPKKIPSRANYQTIPITLGSVSHEDQGVIMKSHTTIPTILSVGQLEAYTKSNLLPDKTISIIPIERFPYVHINRYLSNIKYCALSLDEYFYVKTSASITNNVSELWISAIFQDAIEVQERKVIKDIFDEEIPMEDALINPMIEMIVKEIGSKMTLPQDTINNANDDLNGIKQSDND